MKIHWFFDVLRDPRGGGAKWAGSRCRSKSEELYAVFFEKVIKTLGF